MQAVNDRGLLANEWVQNISEVMGGKGGGSKGSARCTGVNVDALTEAISMAEKFAKMKLYS